LTQQVRKLPNHARTPSSELHKNGRREVDIQQRLKRFHIIRTTSDDAMIRGVIPLKETHSSALHVKIKTKKEDIPPIT
jgi:hypothetical protein